MTGVSGVDQPGVDSRMWRLGQDRRLGPGNEEKVDDSKGRLKRRKKKLFLGSYGAHNLLDCML